MNRLLLLVSFISFCGVGAHADTTLAGWADRISVNGDFRFRHDYDSKTLDTSTTPTKIDNNERQRERLRLRLGLNAKVNDSMTAKVLMSGTDNDDPISTNNTMTNNGQPKAFYIDRAYVEWKICPEATLNAGKQLNPLHILSDSQLLYDDDYNPEGLSLVTNLKSVPLFLTLGGFSIQERNTASTDSHVDSWLLAAMLGYKQDLSNGMGILAAVGYHDFTALKGNTELTGTGGAYGNSVDSNSKYINDYQVGELMAEVHGPIGSLKYSVYVDAAQNFSITKNNTGLIAGFDVKPGQWTLGYAYQTTGTDMTVSAINNSDWASGQDGMVGHLVKVGHPLATNTSVALTYMHARIDNSGNPYSDDRGFLDFNWVF